jgi:hypothetical protein
VVARSRLRTAFKPLRDAEGVVDLHAEIGDGNFELRWSEEELYGSKILGLLVNLSRLCFGSSAIPGNSCGRTGYSAAVDIA